MKILVKKGQQDLFVWIKFFIDFRHSKNDKNNIFAKYKYKTLNKGLVDKICPAGDWNYH